ncbi:MAG TPA: HlyD family secretion protein [Anaeromyxobacteraceae bacterium]|nr:HlyD family secretion protein [Anaeromyxobacteraceae bacterium]
MNMTNAASATVPAAPPPEPLRVGDAPAARPPRRRIFAFVAAGVAVAAALGYGAYWYATRFDVGTDDAQVEADVVPLAPRVSGVVARVLVQENQSVRKGDLLLVIDHADVAAKARQAEAELETARAQATAADAQVGAAEASQRRAGVEAEKAELDLERAELLRKGEAIPPEKLDAAKAAGGVSRAAVASARAQHAAAEAQARLAHARVKAAEAALDLAQLQLSYTKIWAPEDGVVSKLSVHEGQLVSPGQPLAELVPNATYVVANFKETQVGRMRAGQRAVVEIDAYPGVRLEGRVESLSGGTGARFSLIPPDNASGNFVKVVERVPVRVAWAKPPPPEVALRAGLSAYVSVQTR